MRGDIRVCNTVLAPRAADQPTVGECVLLLSLVQRPGETPASASASFVVQDSTTTTQRKRNGTRRRLRRRRRRDDKLVTIVGRWRRERFVRSLTAARRRPPVRYEAFVVQRRSLSFFTADDHFSPDIATAAAAVRQPASFCRQYTLYTTGNYPLSAYRASPLPPHRESYASPPRRHVRSLLHFYPTFGNLHSPSSGRGNKLS